MSYLDKLTGLVRPGTAETGGDSGGGETVDLSFVTAAASDILSGKVGANSSGKPVNGTIPTMAEPTVDGNVVTIGKGYNPSQRTATIPKAAEPTVEGNVVTLHGGYMEPQTVEVEIAEAKAPTVSENVVTIYPGYYSAGIFVRVGTAKAAETITPGTSSKTVAANTFLTGNLIIKGDADLIASNIKKGVQIFNVTGSLDSYQLLLVTKDTATFQGKLVTGYSNGSWQTSGSTQSFTGYTSYPKKGFIYLVDPNDSQAIIGDPIATPYPMFQMPLNGSVAATSYGASVTPQVEGTLRFENGWAVFDGSQIIKTPFDVDFFQKNATICWHVYETGYDRYGYIAGYEDCALGVDNNGGTYNIWAGNSGWNIIESDSDFGRSNVEVKHNQDVHLAYVHDADANQYRLYVNGALAKQITDSRTIGGGTNFRFGGWAYSDMRFVGKMRDCRIYNKALTASQITTVMNGGDV